MAIVKPDGSLSGLVGNGVLRSYDGITVLSAKPDRVRNPRTVSQQTNRLKMRNVVNMYSAMKAALRDNFQGKKGRQSDYTCFQSCNLPQPAVYLTLSECDGSVVAPYIVSFGTLPIIDYHFVDGWLVTQIMAGQELSMDSMVMDLSYYLAECTDVFKKGDTVRLIACSQTVENNFPMAHCDYCEFVIDIENRAPLSKVLNGFELRVDEHNNLCFRREGACGLAMVRRHGEGRSASSSMQFLAVNNPVLENYMSNKHKQLAIASYAKIK